MGTRHLRSKQVQYGIGVGVTGLIQASISLERTQEHGVDYRRGPELIDNNRPPHQYIPWNEPPAFSNRDQGVFIKGWRLKERTSMKASAGPHTLPKPPPEDDDSVIEAFPHIIPVRGLSSSKSAENSF